MDGTVNALDFNALATNFGATPIAGGAVDGAPAALGSLVPEPASLSLLVMGIAAVAPRRRRK